MYMPALFKTGEFPHVRRHFSCRNLMSGLMIINFASSPNHYEVTDQIWVNSESFQSVF
jgi:hypothetical protein